jgi:hypothetical protein
MLIRGMICGAFRTETPQLPTKTHQIANCCLWLTLTNLHLPCTHHVVEALRDPDLVGSLLVMPHPRALDQYLD